MTFEKTDYLMYHKFVEFNELTKEQVLEITGMRKIEIAKKLGLTSLQGLTLAIYEEGELDNTAVLNGLPNNPFLPTVVSHHLRIMKVEDFLLDVVGIEKDEEWYETLEILKGI